MLIKQISVFVENRKGKLFEVTEVLKKANIDIRALTIADTTDFGILRLILSDPDSALEVLKENGFTVSVTNVLAIKVLDQPGGFHSIMQVLKNEDISVEYCYAVISHSSNNAHVILRVDKTEQAVQKLQQAGYQFFNM